jgi:hypothetical protein
VVPEVGRTVLVAGKTGGVACLWGSLPHLEYPMKLAAVSLCCLVLALLAGDAAGEDKERDKQKRPYASLAADCDKAISRKKLELAETYSSEVWNLKQRFQKDGDLEKALAADKEWTRSIRKEPLTPEDLVESPKELRAVQDAYVERQGRVAREVAEEVVGQLQREARELAKTGNLADGQVLQQEIDKIKRLYLSRDNASALRSSPKAGEEAAPRDADVPIDHVAACEEAIRQKRIAIQAQYVGELEAMERLFQAKGALEDLFAAKAERTRFLEVPLLAEGNLVEGPEPLRELQQQYLELQNNAASSAVEQFLERLEQQKQALTIEGKLDEAVKAKTAIDQVRTKLAGVQNDQLKSRVALSRKLQKLLTGRVYSCSSGGTLTFVSERQVRNSFPWRAAWKATSADTIELTLDWPGHRSHGKTSKLTFDKDRNTYKGIGFDGEPISGSVVDH